ncbi:MAG: polyribonucleotide nucleotidyltransferase [Chloroflexi bacterium]|nr:polyribonucleotide nucleotidyltransferase [Chloroflexota bacterium]
MTDVAAAPRLEVEEQTFSTEIEGKTLEIGVGLLAQNATAACTIRYGDTVLLATLTDGEPRAGIDFFPLTVDFEERMYAIGKIPGSFFRREGRPGNEATLAARMTDRPIRPLFPKGYRREIQLVLLTLSSDRENPSDIFGVLGASTTLGMSHVPFEGPVSSVRIGRVDGEYKAFPTYEEIEASDLDLIVAGTEDSIVMIEAGADQVPEAEVIEAVRYAEGIIAQLNALQREVIDAVGDEKTPYEPQAKDVELQARVAADLEDIDDADLLGAVQDEGFRGVDQLGLDVWQRLGGEDDDSLTRSTVRAAVEDEVKALVRRRIIEDNMRPDDRAEDEIRGLFSRVGVIPRAHGAGLFRRGGTQILSIATLGPLADRQRLDTLSPTQFKRYMHHYNFPPFSVGEARPLRGPGRREIGHGLLAERALLPVLPSADDFPYALRVVSEALMSNGSTSMGSVCGSTLALMDAGVPITAPVAGVAMGLITGDGDEYRVLTDIAGVEDGLGDMDFKVAGTEQGVTAVQLDIKLQSLPDGLLETVFERARVARLQILEVMLDAISEPREELSQYAPRVEALQIDREKIGAVIGPGGRVINAMQEETGANINVEDDGTVLVSGTDAEGVRKAMDMIRGLTKEIEVGEIYEGSVVRILDFGAFVEILPGKDGLVHISDLADYHVNRVEDEVSEGETLRVQVIEIDNLGRINLTRLRDGEDGSERVGLSDEAAEAAGREPAMAGDRGPRGGGGGGRGRGGNGGGRGRGGRGGGGGRGPRGGGGDRDGGGRGRGPRGGGGRGEGGGGGRRREGGGGRGEGGGGGRRW